mgnify:CR=1 FL=1
MTTEDLPIYWKEEKTENCVERYMILSMSETEIITIVKEYRNDLYKFEDFKITRATINDFQGHLESFPEIVNNSTKQEFDNLKFEMLNWLDKTFER